MTKDLVAQSKPTSANPTTANPNMQQRLLFVSATEFGVSETSTRFQRLSTLCRHYSLQAVTARPLDDRYQVHTASTTSRGPREFLRAARQAREIPADIVSASGEPLSLIAGVLAKAGRPFVIQVWDDPAKMARIRADVATGWERRQANLRLRAMERFTRSMLAQADLVVLSLDPDRIATLYGIPSQRLLAVPNGALIEPMVLPDATRYAQRHEPPLVVYTGPLQTARIATLIDAARELHRRQYEVTIRLLGPVAQPHHDPLIEDLLTQAPPNVEIMSGLHSGARLRAAVDGADVCVIPYRDTFEIDSAYPIKLFEYFTAAKPVVSTNLWGVRQVATDGHDIVLAPPDDAVAFADGIARVLGDADLRCRLGHNARATATKFSWSAINAEVVSAMDRVINQRDDQSGRSSSARSTTGGSRSDTGRLPNAFLLGAAKAGTTSLAAALGALDGSFVPDEKEPHYFDSDDGFAQGDAWYREFYADAAQARWAWDCTPNYFHRPDMVIPRLRRTYRADELASVRFVVVLRDPVQRAYSHYLHQQRVAAETRSFLDAINDESHSDDWSNYRHDSEYGRQLQQWFAAFDRDQFLVVIVEDFDDYDEVLAQITQYMDLEPAAPMQRLNEHREARSVWLMNVVARPPAAVTAVAQRLVPLRWRRSARTRLRSLNLREASRPELDHTQAAELRQRLAADQDLLGDLLGRQLPWQ